MKTRGISSNATITAATSLLLTGIGLLTGILAARILGVDGRGELAAIQLWPIIIATIAMLGLADSLVYCSARDREHSTQYVATAVLLALSVGSVLVGVGILVLPLLLSGQSVEVVTASRWYLAIIPIFAISSLPYHILRGREDFLAWNTVRITPNATWLVVLIGAAGLGVVSARTVAFASLVSQLILGLVIAYFVIKRVPGPYVPRSRDLRPLLSFGIPSLATTGPNIIAARFDQMLLVAFFSPTMLGLYVVALGWASAVTPLLSAIASVIFPHIAGTSDIEIRNINFARAVRMSVIVACIVVIPVALLAPIMVPLLFGTDFKDAVATSMFLSLSTAIGGVNRVLEEGLRGAGRPASILWAQAAGLPVIFLIMILLLPRWGIEGAGIAVVLGTIIMCIVLLRTARIITSISIKVFCVPTSEDIVLAMMHCKNILQK